MKINSTNSPKISSENDKRGLKIVKEFFLSATPGLIRPQGDIHLINHKIDMTTWLTMIDRRMTCIYEPDDLTETRMELLAAVSTDSDLYLAKVKYFYFPDVEPGVFGTFMFWQHICFLSCPDARKLQEYLGRSISWDPRWRQVSVYSVASLKWVLPILMVGGIALFFCPNFFFDCNNIWKQTTNYEHGQIITFLMEYSKPKDSHQILSQCQND